LARSVPVWRPTSFHFNVCRDNRSCSIRRTYSYHASPF
jgi:hypothetical protein